VRSPLVHHLAIPHWPAWPHGRRYECRGDLAGRDVLPAGRPQRPGTSFASSTPVCSSATTRSWTTTGERCRSVPEANSRTRAMPTPSPQRARRPRQRPRLSARISTTLRSWPPTTASSAIGSDERDHGSRTLLLDGEHASLSRRSCATGSFSQPHHGRPTRAHRPPSVLRIVEHWPWADELVTASARLTASRRSSDTSAAGTLPVPRVRRAHGHRCQCRSPPAAQIPEWLDDLVSKGSAWDPQWSITESTPETRPSARAGPAIRDRRRDSGGPGTPIAPRRRAPTLGSDRRPACHDRRDHLERREDDPSVRGNG